MCVGFGNVVVAYPRTGCWSHNIDLLVDKLEQENWRVCVEHSVQLWVVQGYDRPNQFIASARDT